MPIKPGLDERGVAVAIVKAWAGQVIKAIVRVPRSRSLSLLAERRVRGLVRWCGVDPAGPPVTGRIYCLEVSG